ncbi:MAG: small multi-drug export protein [Candidatus Nezhaarchaeota archaeon]|nr:small multi-drug export protein [Candidatus Nezhaarchaeota archaeon]
MSSLLEAPVILGALTVFITALLPLLEARAAVPLGLALGLSPVLVLSVTIIGNSLPVPFLLSLLSRLEAFLTRQLREDGPGLLTKLARLYFKLVWSARNRAGPYVDKYGALGLAIFTAIPLPFTGAWTASLAAHVLGMKRGRAVLSIWLGVLAAVLIVYVLALLVGTVARWP